MPHLQSLVRRALVTACLPRRQQASHYDVSQSTGRRSEKTKTSIAIHSSRVYFRSMLHMCTNISARLRRRRNRRRRETCESRFFNIMRGCLLFFREKAASYFLLAPNRLLPTVMSQFNHCRLATSIS